MRSNVSSRVLFAGLLSFAGCDYVSQSDHADLTVPPTQTASQTPTDGELALNVVALNAGHDKAAAAVAEDPPDSSWSIVSGPPDAMTVYVKRIDLERTGEPSVALYASPDANGTALALTSGAVDLGQLGHMVTHVPFGAYTRVVLTLSRAARIKGCVSGNFAAAQAATGQGTPGSPHANNTYQSETLSEGEHTFCTIGSRSQLSAGAFTTDLIGSNADFEAQHDPEWVEIDLGGNQGVSETADEIRAGQTFLAYPITFAIGPALSNDHGNDHKDHASAPTQLTLVVDLNRMLRFYANTRTDFNPPNPNMKTGTSYFFTTVFVQSTGLFLGRAGRIDGYKLRVDGPNVVIPGWMSLVRDVDDHVVTGLVMPDDDNTLTILKGVVVPQGIHAVANGIEIPFELGSGKGALVGFAYQQLGDPTATCDLRPLDTTTGVQGPFTVDYSRQL